MAKSDNSSKEFKDKRQGVLKLYSVGTSVILVVILIVFNILFESILGKYMSFDFSLSGYNSLQQKTIDYLNSLPEGTNIRIVGLFEKPDSYTGTPNQYIIPLMDSYVKEGKGKISVEYVDPKTYPSIMSQLDPQGVFDLKSDTYVVSDGKKAVSIDPIDCFTYDMDYYNRTGYYMPIANTVEYTFDNAIYRLTSGISHKAYFVTGLRNDNSNHIKKIIGSMGFDTADIQASTSFTVPDDCDILFINGPQTDIPENMITPIKDYLFVRNGKLMISVDYSENNFSEVFTNLNNILENYNIAVSNLLVRENNPNYMLSEDGLASNVTVAGDFAAYTSAKVLRSSMARSIKEVNNPSSSIVTSVVLTTSADATAIDLNSQDSSTGLPATYNVGMFGTFKDNPESSKVLVFGTMSLTSDDYISSFGYNDSNVEFTRGCIRSLVGLSSDNVLQVESKSIDDYKINAEKATSTNATIMTVIFMLVIPFGLVIVAVIVYKLRKNL